MIIDSTIRDLDGLDLLGLVAGRPVLRVDACPRCGQLPQIGGGCADEARELAETPIHRRDRFVRARQDKAQLFGVVAW